MHPFDNTRHALPARAVEVHYYVVKPFNVAELVARIRAVGRRVTLGTSRAAEPPPPHKTVHGALSIDRATRAVAVDGRPISLTPKEFDLLALLCRRPGVVYHRERIISEVWSTGWAGTPRTLEVHVAALRRKLGQPQLIETMRGVGYRLAIAAPATR